MLYVLGQAELARCLFPVGHLTKAEVRAHASSLGLVTADKPDSQDVCFITTAGGREAFLSPRIALTPGRVVGLDGAAVGRVDAVELVTVGQRRGLGTGGGDRRFALSVDPSTGTVVAGSLADLHTDRVELTDLTWVGGRPRPGRRSRPRPAPTAGRSRPPSTATRRSSSPSPTAGWRRARAWSSTTATGSSAAASPPDSRPVWSPALVAG